MLAQKKYVEGRVSRSMSVSNISLRVFHSYMNTGRQADEVIDMRLAGESQQTLSSFRVGGGE